MPHTHTTVVTLNRARWKLLAGIARSTNNPRVRFLVGLEPGQETMQNPGPRQRTSRVQRHRSLQRLCQPRATRSLLGNHSPLSFPVVSSLNASMHTAGLLAFLHQGEIACFSSSAAGTLEEAHWCLGVPEQFSRGLLRWLPALREAVRLELHLFGGSKDSASKPRHGRNRAGIPFSRGPAGPGGSELLRAGSSRCAPRWFVFGRLRHVRGLPPCGAVARAAALAAGACW